MHYQANYPRLTLNMVVFMKMNKSNKDTKLRTNLVGVLLGILYVVFVPKADNIFYYQTIR